MANREKKCDFGHSSLPFFRVIRQKKTRTVSDFTCKIYLSHVKPNSRIPNSRNLRVNCIAIHQQVQERRGEEREKKRTKIDRQREKERKREREREPSYELWARNRLQYLNWK